MGTRFIFEVLKEDKVVCQFTDNMSTSDKLKIILNSDKTKIKEKEVTDYFYQDIVDSGGLIEYI